MLAGQPVLAEIGPQSTLRPGAYSFAGRTRPPRPHSPPLVRSPRPAPLARHSLPLARTSRRRRRRKLPLSAEGGGRGRGRLLARCRSGLWLWQVPLQAGLCAKASGPVLLRPSPEHRCRTVPMLRFPTCFPSFRVVGEKQLPQEIVFLVWSPKRDLIALANTSGEVSEPARNPSRLQPQFPLLQKWRISCLPCPYIITSWQLTSRKGPSLLNVVYSSISFVVKRTNAHKVVHTQVAVNWSGQGCTIRADSTDSTQR